MAEARKKGRFGGRRRLLTGKRQQMAAAQLQAIYRAATTAESVAKRDSPSYKRTRATDLPIVPAPISPVTGKVMTVIELAAHYKISRSTLLRWARPGYFDGATNDAARFRERHDDLGAWLADPRQAPPPRRERGFGGLR